MTDTPTPPENPDEPPREDSPPTGPTQPMAAGPQPRRLTRSSSDKVIGGVSGGLGRYFDIDPIIFRIGFVVLALAGGAGVLGYLAAWLLVPADPAAGEEPEDRSRIVTIVGAVVLGDRRARAARSRPVLPRAAADRLALVGFVGVLLCRAAGGHRRRSTRRRKIGLGLLLIVVAGLGFVAVAVGSASAAARSSPGW